MKGTKLFSGILVAVATMAGTTLASPAEAKSNANWELNRLAVQMYQQNMAVKAQVDAQAAAQAQADLAYRQQLAAQNAIAAQQQAQCNNPYVQSNLNNPYVQASWNNPYVQTNWNNNLNSNISNSWSERQRRAYERRMRHHRQYGF